MKTFSVALRSPVWLLAAALLCGGANRSLAELASTQPILVGSVRPVGQADASRAPVLVGQLVTPVIKHAASGNAVHLKTGVSLSNTGTKAAKNVTVTAYLSDDGVLSADDTELITLMLADYNDGSGKLAKGQSLTVPLHYKVPGALAAAFVGKYLIFVVKADNAAASTTVVYGPIELP